MREESIVKPAPVDVLATGLSDVGRVRPGNEDAFLVDLDHGLFIVSDGMGGAQAGALASKIVVSVLPRMIKTRLERLEQARPRAMRYWLRHDILKLSRQLHRQSAGEVELKGMGATVVLALLRDGCAHIAHMGDSRAYMFHGGELKQVTDDHSIVGILLRNSEITQEEASHHPAQGKLSRYVGMPGDVFPDVCTLRLAPGDRLLLCSDGLTTMIPDAEIARALTASETPQDCCEALVAAANAAGGHDNVTVVLVSRPSAERCHG